MKKFFLLLTIISTVAVSQAQRLTPHRGEVPNAYNFWFYEPPADTLASAKPLIVFLHGRSLCGNNLNRVLRYGPIDALEKGMVIDAFVMSPQAAGSWNPDRVVRLVDWARENYAVDTNRIYLIGMSLGGYGTLDVAGTYPDRFAAAMALCGGSTLKEHCGLNRLPLWILHGTADRAVGISASQRVVDAMRSCDTASRLLWKPLKGASHGRLARIFYLPQTYDWLFAHSLADSSRTLCRDFDITMDDLSGKDVYRAVRSGGNKVVRMQGTTGTQEDVAKGAEEFHTVKKGDTLSAIARKNHTTVKKLCRLNGIKASAKLQPGQRLRVR